MNKFSIMIKSVVITMSMIGVAHADLNNWTGFYAGVNGGFVFNNAQLKSQQLGFTSLNEMCNTSLHSSTFSPGVQLGYLHQFPNHVVSGIEATATLNTNQTNTLSCNSDINPNVYDRFTFRNQMQTSVKARVGRLLNLQNVTFLPYLTAGGSFANVGLTYKNEGGDYYSNSTIQSGWLIGAGVEWPFREHWSLRMEYDYVDYGNVITLRIPSVYGLEDSNGSGRVGLSSNDVVVGVSYWV